MKLSLIVTILFLGFHFSSSQWIPDNEGSFQGLCTEGILPKISLIDGIEQVMLESCVDRCRRHPKCAAIDWIGEPGMDLINYQCNLYAGKPNPSTGSKNSDSTHPWGERKCYLLPMTNKATFKELYGIDGSCYRHHKTCSFDRECCSGLDCWSQGPGDLKRCVRKCKDRSKSCPKVPQECNSPSCFNDECNRKNYRKGCTEFFPTTGGF